MPPSQRRRGRGRERASRPPGHVRIIGGHLRGSRLEVPDLAGLRPTPQRLRQTLFDWLAPVIEGARVLDVFAGSGVLGIEALSRGAGDAVFLERDPARARALAADLARLGQQAATVRHVDALAALAEPAPRPFDIVFLDPPFADHAWTRAAGLLDAGGWLAPRAFVYVETGVHEEWDVPAGWCLHRQRDAGAVRATLFRAGPAREV